MSCPSLKMAADTSTFSPTTALAGYAPVGVRGLMSSITMRRITRPRLTIHAPRPVRSKAMKALRSFTVRAKLPAELAPLEELAMNLRWSWDERTRDLFRWVDPQQWEDSSHDPVRLLGLASRERLQQLVSDPAFRGFLAEIHGDLRRYMDAPRWFQNRPASALRAIAYFSPEFGIAEALPQYSGGLGVLAGDHLKAASGLGIPLSGVGIRYQQGYF